MGYVLAGLLVVVIVALAVAVFWRSARRQGEQGRNAAADAGHASGLPGGGAAIAAADDGAPLGDTREHTGEQRDGETVADPDAAGRRGAGHSGNGGMRPLVGGEAEGTRRPPERP
jgi:hypothetical protein